MNLPHSIIEPFGIIGFPGPVEKHKIIYERIKDYVEWYLRTVKGPLTRAQKKKLKHRALWEGAKSVGIEETKSGYEYVYVYEYNFYIIKVTL